MVTFIQGSSKKSYLTPRRPNQGIMQSCVVRWPSGRLIKAW